MCYAHRSIIIRIQLIITHKKAPEIHFKFDYILVRLFETSRCILPEGERIRIILLIIIYKHFVNH